MRLAVFTSKYPARISTFFERDMLGLLEAGIDLRIFSLYPRDDSLWEYSLDAAAGGALRARTEHISAGDAARAAATTLGRHPMMGAAQASLALTASARYGPVPVAKTGYVLPKAWAWAARYPDAFDHVLAYWGNYAGTCAWAFHQAIGGRLPFSLWLHAGTDLYARPILLRRKLRHADNIITCCRFNRDYLLEHFGDVRPSITDRIVVSHHGLDLRDFPYVRHGRAPTRVVAVGRLSRYKGFDYLLQAIARLAERGREVSLDLVGGGELEGALRQQAVDLGILDRVRFRGWVRHEAARRVMTEGAILVHPSDGLGDGLPNVLREAMALGLPVIASAVAGIPEALAEGCGVLVPPREPLALADAIDALLADPARAGRIAENARRRVERDYDAQANARRLAAVLEQTRRRPRPPAGEPNEWDRRVAVA